MELKDKQAWNEWWEANRDNGYGQAVMEYTERWANLMEQALEQGAQLEDIADSTSHDADTDGITGFMYGCAVTILSRCWIHGEKLRRWHNLKSQIHDEGERANETGGVLNPALLNLSVSEK